MGKGENWKRIEERRERGEVEGLFSLSHHHDHNASTSVQQFIKQVCKTQILTHTNGQAVVLVSLLLANDITASRR